MDIPKELIEDLKNKDVVLFVGAGISMNAGLPGWAELFRPLSEAVGYNWPTDGLSVDHLLTVAQYYENKKGRHALVKRLIDNLETTNKRPSDVHYLIAQLPVGMIFTTNYDDLLERAYKESGQRAIVIVENLEFAFSREKEIKIIKLCGDATRPSSMVVTKRDFNIFFISHDGILDKLRHVLETKTVLFLGYSMKDPFLNQIWDAISHSFGEYQRLGYCILFSPDPLEVDDLEKRKLHVIALSDPKKTKHDLLIAALQSIIDLASV